MDKKKVRKGCFYLLLLILAILTSIDFFKLIRSYLTENVDTDMYIQFNDTMTMPNLTFCMDRMHAWSHFNRVGLTAEMIDGAVEDGLNNMTDHDSFMKKPWDYKMIMDAYMVIQALNSLEREAGGIGTLNSINNLALNPRMEGVRKAQKKWLSAIAARNVSFEEFQQKVGQETLQRSLQRFQRLRTTEDGRQIRNSIKITWISQMQLCFQPQFDKDNFKPIEDQDQFFTLSMAHNTDIVDLVDCMSLDVKGRPSSESRFMEGKGRSMDGFFDEICIGDSYELEIEIRSIYTSLPGAEEAEKRCLPYGSEKDEGQGSLTSEFECRSRCRMELIRKACSCTPLTLSYLASEEDIHQFPMCDYASCKIDPHKFNFSTWDETCGAKCYPDCTQARYIVRHTKKTAPRKEVLQVTLLWGSFEYLRLLQKEKWSFSKFFSNLGGSLGVWLGLSVLSVIQFITFLLTRAHKRVKRKASTVSRDGGNDGRSRSRSKVSDASSSGGSSRSSNNPLGAGISMNPFGAKKEK